MITLNLITSICLVAALLLFVYLLVALLRPEKF